MSAITSTIPMRKDETSGQCTGLYRLGAVMSLLILGTALLEILITFLPGGYTTTDTVVDWFNLLQEHPFLGLRNLGLLNIVMTAFGIPVFLALCLAHWKVEPKYSALALLISLTGTSVFYATNRAFAMLDLSGQYAAAGGETQRLVLEAAGQSMLAVGQSHTPGTFIGFCLAEIAGVLISVVMLRGGIFSRVNAWSGILGFGMLGVYEICQSFIPGAAGFALIFAMAGGILNLVWYGMTAHRLFKLA